MPNTEYRASSRNGLISSSLNYTLGGDNIVTTALAIAERDNGIVI